jgi:hypothetical protein
MRSYSSSLVLTLLIFASGFAAAQPSPPASAERQAILDYQLTTTQANHLIVAMSAMTRYLVSLPDFKDRLAKSAKMTGAERVAQMEKDAAAMAILKANALTARDYPVGVPTLRMALIAAQGGSSANIVASPANVAFAKANLAELKPKMEAADAGK